MRKSKLALRLLWLAAAAAAAFAVFEAPASRPGLREEMSVDEFQRCGLHKLNSEELATLDAWFELRRCSNLTAGSGNTSPPAEKPAVLPPTGNRWPPSMPDDGIVSFNTSTRKYHCPTCPGALRCTRNCIPVKRSEALARGGVACQICGGSCN